MATSVPTVPLGGAPQVPARGNGVAPRSAYFHGERSTFLNTWRPQLREMSDDVRVAWKVAAARAVEGIQNSGFLAGIVDYLIGRVIGTELDLMIEPDAKALGWSEDVATDWAEMVEERFALWANDPQKCDAGGRMTVGQMQQLSLRSWLGYGEVVALLPLIPRPNWPGLTKVLMLPPSRLEQLDNEIERICQGVKCDSYGYPLSYWFEAKDRFGIKSDVEIQAFDRAGRRNVSHVFEPSLGAARGITPLASILKVTRQVDQLCDATVTAALLQTIFAATVKTNLQGQAAFEGLFEEFERRGKKDDGGILEAFAAAKGEWYDGAKIDLARHGRIAHLFPNDELDFHESKHPSQTFDAFMSWLCREFASALRVTYESATGDYRNATYSSVRMGSSMEDDVVKVRRKNIPVPFTNAILETWADEEIATGRIEYPGGYGAFKAQKEFALRRNWAGPPKPQADDLKTAKAHETLKNIGIGTQQSRSAEYGQDWRSNMRQQKRERDFAKKLGLPDPYPPLPPPGSKDALGDKPAGEQDDDNAKSRAA